MAQYLRVLPRDLLIGNTNYDRSQSNFDVRWGKLKGILGLGRFGDFTGTQKVRSMPSFGRF